MTSSKTINNLIVVPLRLRSTRLKRKILAPIGDQFLAERVLKRALKIEKRLPNTKVVAAVDSIITRNKLLNIFKDDLEIVLTNSSLRSGTDRVFAAFKILNRRKIIKSKDIKTVINLQGDMPFFDPTCIQSLIKHFAKTKKDESLMWTLVQDWPRSFDPKNLSHVNAVLAKNKKALYFSRYPIPSSRNFNINHLLFHIGIYAYTPTALKQFCNTQSPIIEQAESLEQLRALHIGIPFYAEKILNKKNFSFHGIDTASDLRWANNFAKKNGE